MKCTSVAPLIAESERVIAAAIKHFGLKVTAERIIVTIQSKGRKSAIGWFAHDRWQNGDPKQANHEINLSAEYLKEHNMGETLLHELAHAENHAIGIVDCVGKRHNKKFKAMAERLGLEVKDRDKQIGYGFTDLADAGKRFLEKCSFKRELFQSFRLDWTNTKKDTTRLIKCACPSCGYTVRTTAKWIEQGRPTCPCGEEMEQS